jgi:hypothetical protein
VQVFGLEEAAGERVAAEVLGLEIEVPVDSTP